MINCELVVAHRAHHQHTRISSRVTTTTKNVWFVPPPLSRCFRTRCFELLFSFGVWPKLSPDVDGRATTRHLHGITERAARCDIVKVPAESADAVSR